MAHSTSRPNPVPLQALVDLSNVLGGYGFGQPDAIVGAPEDMPRLRHTARVDLQYHRLAASRAHASRGVNVFGEVHVMALHPLQTTHANRVPGSLNGPVIQDRRRLQHRVAQLYRDG